MHKQCQIFNSFDSPFFSVHKNFVFATPSSIQITGHTNHHAFTWKIRTNFQIVGNKIAECEECNRCARQISPHFLCYASSQRYHRNHQLPATRHQAPTPPSTAIAVHASSVFTTYTFTHCHYDYLFYLLD